jgi:hypothetical protein
MDRAQRSAIAVVLCLAFGLAGAWARADNAPKMPVAFGKWTGPHAPHFKSALRSGLAKDCVVVRAEKARVIIDGEVTEKDNKHFVLRVMVNSAKTKELVESKEYTFSKPDASQAQSRKMGHDVFEIARRTPE